MIIWFFGVLLFFTLAFFLIAYICYRMTFLVLPKHRIAPDDLPNAEQYAVLHEKMLPMIHTAMDIPFEEVRIQSEDGYTLYGRYYEKKPGAPVQIQFHGYRSQALRDFCGGMQYAMSCGCNVLLVDQRAHGKSQGKCLAFGILERFDCRAWVKYISERCGKETPIILVGMSMGAATVLMASDLDMPGNVAGIVADCGYDSPKAIIQRVIKMLHYPPRAAYAMVRLGGRIYGGFDIEAHDAPRALANTKIPVLLIHGEDDRFVPCDMSRASFEACASQKTLFTVPEAGHGLSYMIDPEGYQGAIRRFLGEIGVLEGTE